MMARIVYQKRDRYSVKMDEKYIKSKNGQMKLCQTTVGWSIILIMTYGIDSWKPLKIRNKSSSVDITEYSLDRGINQEPDFLRCFPYTLIKNNVVILPINLRVKKRNHKYGVEVPTSFKDAMRLDNLNGNTHW